MANEITTQVLQDIRSRKRTETSGDLTKAQVEQAQWLLRATFDTWSFQAVSYNRGRWVILARTETNPESYTNSNRRLHSMWEVRGFIREFLPQELAQYQ